MGAEFPTAIDLLAGSAPGRSRRLVTVHLEDVEIVLAPEWLADLHDPTLVISQGYVGPDRRQGDRSPPGYGGADGRTRRAGPVRAHRPDRVHHAGPRRAADPDGRRLGAVVPDRHAVPGRLHRARRIGPAGSTATPGQVARAGAARQRALARRQLAAGTPAGGGAVSAVQAASGPGVTHQQLRASAADQARVAAKRQAAQTRADAQAAAAQRRAAVQAAAAQRRALTQATRAQTQATGAGGGGHRSGGAVVALPLASLTSRRGLHRLSRAPGRPAAPGWPAFS